MQGLQLRDYKGHLAIQPVLQLRGIMYPAQVTQQSKTGVSQGWRPRPPNIIIHSGSDPIHQECYAIQSTLTQNPFISPLLMSLGILSVTGRPPARRNVHSCSQKASLQLSAPLGFDQQNIPPLSAGFITQVSCPLGQLPSVEISRLRAVILWEFSFKMAAREERPGEGFQVMATRKELR